MSRKLRPKNMTIANQWQCDQMTKLDKSGLFTAAIEACMDEIGPIVDKHPKEAAMLVLMGLLDGAESEKSGMADAIREWHQRAVTGKRSWEAN